jgi:hypothetical protein
MDFDYKKYSLENLEKWMSDALLSSEATPQEIYGVIHKVVEEEYHYFKHHTGRCYELLALLNGNGNSIIEGVKAHGELWDKEDRITFYDKDDPSPECQKSWNDFWEEYYYPEEALEYGLANPTLTKDRISNFPGEQYSEEELNAMCDKAASDQEKDKCREYNLREAEYYNKRAKLDAEHSKYYYDYTRNDPNRVNPFNKKTWVLPVEEVENGDTMETEYFITFPDDLLEAANLKIGNSIEWIDQGDGSYLLKKIEKEPMTHDKMIAAGWTMTADDFWIKE